VTNVSVVCVIEFPVCECKDLAVKRTGGGHCGARG
jgi:hypothetical protein